MHSNATIKPKEILKFMPFSSCINPSFWFELTRTKLDEYKLNDDFKNLFGFYNNYSNTDLPPIINFDYSSFSKDKFNEKSSQTVIVSGQIKIFNTINEFNIADKNKILEDFTNQLWSDIKSGNALENTRLLNRFSLITFANLKNYVFHYWFAFPAITFPNKSYHLLDSNKFDNVFSNEQKTSFLQNLTLFHQEQNSSFFAVDFDNLNFLTVKDGVEKLNSNSIKRVLFGFYDSNSQTEHASWPLRNFLTLLSYHCSNRDTIEIILLRDRYKNGVRNMSNSIVLTIELINIPNEINKIGYIGWEKNEKQQLMPRVVDMSQSMNTEKLAENAVSLNLKLMKWRVAPNVDLDIVKNYKCLLLGSGTLGCNVARCLLGWGVDTITFVDNSKVSFSNPVRQSLFTFNDSKNTGENFKSVIAAESLKLIYPGVNTRGIVLSIPMPGHFVNEAIRKKTEDDVKQLDQLIRDHDCVFLLMDTRESRWLPTLLAAVHKKLVINAALGFDSFLVMRHGVKTDNESITTPISVNNRVPGNLLGCYFCNDIVAPGNSTVDRTLDQQCTVSRPGLSMIASALAVELLVSCLQHPLKHQAPSDTNSSDFDNGSSCLGIIPHQIRGYLHTYSTILPSSQAFDKCTACSNKVIDLYNQHGFDFLVNAFNDNSYLEDVTGLTKLKNEFDINEPEFILELSDSDNDI